MSPQSPLTHLSLLSPITSVSLESSCSSHNSVLNLLVVQWRSVPMPILASTLPGALRSVTSLPRSHSLLEKYL